MRWDEFLAAFWSSTPAAASVNIDMPVCRATTEGCVGLANPLPVQVIERRVLLPLISRQ